MILMGLDDEADEARELIATQLSFDHDIDVKHFEITIRLLGGLLSGYQLTGDERLLELADDLGTRLLPAFDSPTGLPYVDVNLRTGKAQGNDSNPAEAGTLLLEYGTLAQAHRQAGLSTTRPSARWSKPTSGARSIGLVGERFDVEHRQVDAAPQPCRRAHRLLLRVPVEVLAPVRRRAIAWRCGTPSIAAGQPLSRRRGRRRAVVRPCRHAHRQAHRQPQYGALDAFYPGLARATPAMSTARARLQDSAFRDVEPARHRAGGVSTTARAR